MPQIEKDYVDTGKLRHVFMDFPLEMHKDAFKASEAGLCAGDQGKFWEMHDLLFVNQKELKLDDLVKYAKALALDMTRFTECINTGKHADEIKQVISQGQKAGITGTPAFLLGFIQQNGKVKAVKKITGARPYDAFRDLIEELLKSQKK